MSSDNSKTSRVQFIDITAAQAGQRIDNFLLNIEKGVPKSRIYRALRKGEVRVNKGRIKQTYKLQPGDQVRVPPLRTSEKKTPTFVSDSLKQVLLDSIVFEDDALLVLNKPSGLAVHAGTEIQLGVIEALRLVFTEFPFLELVHRLDRETSGCLLLAKSRKALLELQRQMVNDEMDKRYLTLLEGLLGDAPRLVEQPLQKNTITSGERMVIVDPAGKPAKTRFIPVRACGDSQFTEVELFTGRTHQIRVHAAHIGHPVAGDDKYGDREFNKTLKQYGLKRLFLHAWKLTIKHPLTGNPLELIAPLPMDLENVLTNLEAVTV